MNAKDSMVEVVFEGLLRQIESIQFNGFNDLALAFSFQEDLDHLLDMWNSASSTREQWRVLDRLNELVLPVLEAELMREFVRFMRQNPDVPADKVQKFLDQGQNEECAVRDRVKALRAGLRELSALKRQVWERRQREEAKREEARATRPQREAAAAARRAQRAAESQAMKGRGGASGPQYGTGKGKKRGKGK